MEIKKKLQIFDDLCFCVWYTDLLVYWVGWTDLVYIQNMMSYIGGLVSPWRRKEMDVTQIKKINYRTREVFTHTHTHLYVAPCDKRKKKTYEPSRKKKIKFHIFTSYFFIFVSKWLGCVWFWFYTGTLVMNTMMTWTVIISMLGMMMLMTMIIKLHAHFPSLP